MACFTVLPVEWSAFFIVNANNKTIDRPYIRDSAPPFPWPTSSHPV
jgi:hypothetical protein